MQVGRGIEKTAKALVSELKSMSKEVYYTTQLFDSSLYLEVDIAKPGNSFVRLRIMNLHM